MSTSVTPEQRARIRAQFPALARGTVLLENAGGSQVPRQVADAIRGYLLDSYVQLGAGYALSRRATELVDRAHAFARLLVGGEAGQVVLGPSTSQLLRMLADCHRAGWRPGDEIVVAECGHEANLGPWKALQRDGAVLRWWRIDPETGHSPLEGLAEILGEHTRLVCFPHVSNLLGEIVDVRAATSLAHAAGARVVVDGVAYAPHRAIDCTGWDVDWYAYSLYKVYGPHMAVLYGRDDALAGLTGPNHFFVRDDEVPYKFELGGVCHEGCAGLLALGDYLKAMLGEPEDAEVDRSLVERAFALMAACEEAPTRRLLSWLAGREDVRVVGPGPGGRDRVGTVSFVHASLASREIAAAVDASDVAIRHGHMYAYHLCEALGLDPEDGVVRTSLVHYNTEEEIDRLLAVLAATLDRG